jgi:hypothetical protein
MIARPLGHPATASFSRLGALELLAIAVVSLPCARAERIGIFEQHADVGPVGLQGSADFDASVTATDRYSLDFPDGSCGGFQRLAFAGRLRRRWWSI